MPALHDYEPGSMLGGTHRVEGLSDSQQKGAWAESSVFNLLPQRRDETSIWGTYFGPMARFTQQNGTEISMPDIKDIDLEIVEYWQTRSKEALHPSSGRDTLTLYGISGKRLRPRVPTLSTRRSQSMPT